MSFFKKIGNLILSERSNDNFFDKEATIKEYFSLIPKEEREPAKDYEELYQIALKYVKKQSFKENTKEQEDYFKEIGEIDGQFAIFVGIIAYLTAYTLDYNGKNIEKSIDKSLEKINKNLKGYDTNNPFDAKQGVGHRMFGHDIATFGLKNIPGDYLIRINGDIVKIGDYLGVGTKSKVSMWDLINAFYGKGKPPLKRLFSCFSHIIVHFAKDLFTPAGIPLPFLSLFNKYEKLENGTASYLTYRNSLIKKFDDKHINMKASDFVSYFVIKTLVHFYCDSKGYNEKKESFKYDISLISMATCISLQMATIVIGEASHVGKKGYHPSIDGGKVNVLMMSDFFKIAIKDMNMVLKTDKAIKEKYNTNYMEDYYNGK